MLIITSEQIKIRHYGDLLPNSYARCISFSLNDQFLAVGSTNEGVLIYRIKDWKVVHEIPQEETVWSIEWSPDGKFLASGSINEPVKIWKTDDWREYLTLDKSEEAMKLNWSSDGKFLAIGTSGSSDNRPFLDIWKTSDWSKIKNEISQPSYPIFSHDSSMLAIDNELLGYEILSLPNFNRLKLLDFSDSEKHVSLFNSFWSYDDTLFVGSCGDGRIRVWRTKDWQEVFTKQLHDFWEGGKYGVSFSPNGKYLLSGGFGEPKLLSTESWRIVYNFPKGTLADFYDSSWRSDSKLLTLLLGDGKRIELWEIID